MGYLLEMEGKYRIKPTLFFDFISFLVFEKVCKTKKYPKLELQSISKQCKSMITLACLHTVFMQILVPPCNVISGFTVRTVMVIYIRLPG